MLKLHRTVGAFATSLNDCDAFFRAGICMAHPSSGWVCSCGFPRANALHPIRLPTAVDQCIAAGWNSDPFNPLTPGSSILEVVADLTPTPITHAFCPPWKTPPIPSTSAAGNNLPVVGAHWSLFYIPIFLSPFISFLYICDVCRIRNPTKSVYHCPLHFSAPISS